MDHIQLIKNYEKALSTYCWDSISFLLHENCTFLFNDGTYIGKEPVSKAFIETFNKIKNEKYKINNLRWIYVKENSASCIYNFSWSGIINKIEKKGSGRGSSVLIKENNKWSIILEHLDSFTD